MTMHAMAPAQSVPTMDLRHVQAWEIEQRRLYKTGLPQTALDDVHVEGCALLPSREALLARLPARGMVAEVGVDHGVFSEAILRVCDPQMLVLIDLWGDARFGGGHAAVTAKFEGDARVSILRGMSVEMMDEMVWAFAGRFDWIYIDTTHSYADTAAELLAAARLVKPGGYICGDDHCPGNIITPVPYGVIEAVQEFCVRDRWGYRYLTMDRGGHSSFALQRLDPA